MKFTLTIAVIMVALLSLAINFRHDVDIKKYEEKGKESQFKAVGKILKSGIGDFKGSCVLINSRYVLTSAHQMEGTVTAPDTIQRNGRMMIVYKVVDRYYYKPDSLEVEFSGNIVGVKDIIIHPKYRDTINDVDLAIIELQEPVKNIEPAQLNVKIESLKGKVCWGAGWGVVESGDRSYQEPPGTKRLAGSNRVDSSDKYGLWLDFDHPTNDTCCNELGSPVATDMEFGPNGGDSGSGLFYEQNNKYFLVGIMSTTQYKINLAVVKKGIDFNYGSLHQYTNVYPVREWILSNSN